MPSRTRALLLLLLPAVLPGCREETTAMATEREFHAPLSGETLRWLEQCGVPADVVAHYRDGRMPQWIAPWEYLGEPGLRKGKARFPTLLPAGLTAIALCGNGDPIVVEHETGRVGMLHMPDVVDPDLTDPAKELIPKVLWVADSIDHLWARIAQGWQPESSYWHEKQRRESSDRR